MLQGLFASSILNEECFVIGKNVVHQLTVTLEDLYNGATRKLALQKNVICDKCEGRGGKKGAVECCPNYQGTGMQIIIHQIGPGMV